MARLKSCPSPKQVSIETCERSRKHVGLKCAGRSENKAASKYAVSFESECESDERAERRR